MKVWSKPKKNRSGKKNVFETLEWILFSFFFRKNYRFWLASKTLVFAVNFPLVAETVLEATWIQIFQFSDGAFLKQKLAGQQNLPNDNVGHNTRSSTNKRGTALQFFSVKSGFTDSLQAGSRKNIFFWFYAISDFYLRTGNLLLFWKWRQISAFFMTPYF